MRASLCVSLLLAGLTASCGGSSVGPVTGGREEPTPTTPVISATSVEQIRLFEDFERDQGGWSVGWSDFPLAEEENYELSSQRVSLLPEADISGQGLFIAGTDRDDGLFMFLKKEVTGLVPGQEYEVRIEASLVLKYPEPEEAGDAGVDPSLHLKVGALAFEPLRILSSDGNWLMNLDKGPSFQGGVDMVDLGELLEHGEEFRFTILARGNDSRPIRVQANPQGSLWLILGTDSSAGLRSEIYYDNIEAEFSPLD